MARLLPTMEAKRAWVVPAGERGAVEWMALAPGWVVRAAESPAGVWWTVLAPESAGLVAESLGAVWRMVRALASAGPAARWCEA